MSLLTVFQRLVLTLSLETFLLATCLFGDSSLTFVANTKSSRHTPWIRAVVDNSTHFFVGFLSWAVVEVTVVTTPSMKTFINCLVCGGLSSLVDVDHFIAARSFKLQDALSLESRPPFHATTIIPAVSFLLCCTGQAMGSTWLKLLSFIYTTSWLSHHIRDATRRGLWLPPLGSSPALPYWMYIFLTLLLPLCVRACIYVCKSQTLLSLSLCYSENLLPY